MVKKIKKEAIELAEEHLKLAEELVIEQYKKERPEDDREFREAQFALEKAESEVKDLE